MTDKPIEGRCLCGEARFQAKSKPIWVGHCHCESCRRNTGSAVATFVGFRQDQVEFTAGERQFYQSSPGVRRGFCGSCGTPLSYEAKKFPGETHIYLCTLDNPERFVAEFHVFYAERVPWFKINDDIPRFQHTSKDS